MRQGIKEKDIRDVKKCAERLADLMRRIQKYNPEAHIYVCMDSFLLFGTENKHQGEELCEVYVPNTDCGEW